MKPIWMTEIDEYALRNDCDLYYDIYDYDALVHTFIEHIESAMSDMEIVNITEQYYRMRNVILSDDRQVPKEV